jgi:hypothetical protein
MTIIWWATTIIWWASLPGKSVVMPGLLDGFAGYSFASLIQDLVVQFGLLALVLGVIGAKILGGEQR